MVKNASMSAISDTSTEKNPGLSTGLLTVGFIVAVLLRVTVGGIGVSRSADAGLIFAVCLILLSLSVGGVSWRIDYRSIGIGLAGAVVLCLPAFIAALLQGHHMPSATGYWSWAWVVAVVAFTEELFLRGVLFNVLARWQGRLMAVLGSSVAFAGLHVPLYGWHSVPLDLAVGVLLGMLRIISGSFVAPGIAHVATDLFSWWVQ